MCAVNIWKNFPQTHFWLHKLHTISPCCICLVGLVGHVYIAYTLQPCIWGSHCQESWHGRGRVVEAIATPGWLAITKLKNVTVTINISHWTQSVCIPNFTSPLARSPNCPRPIQCHPAQGEVGQRGSQSEKRQWADYS